VKVDGPTLGPGGRWVKVGEQLSADLNGGPPRAAAESSPSTSPLDPEKAAPAKVDGTQARAKSWKELAEHRQYGEALAAAEAAGFEASCRAASASDLVLLGNAARFAGSGARAEQAFRLVRSRFAGTAQASMAAFHLGRIAYDQVGDRRQAAEWFQSYLREAPGGPFAREAAGRLLEAQRALGDRNAARAAARTYLQKYPSGPHAALAHEVLEP
jgi:TolA-binding protein